MEELKCSECGDFIYGRMYFYDGDPFCHICGDLDRNVSAEVAPLVEAGLYHPPQNLTQ